MNRKIILAVLVVLLLVAGAVGLGVYSYNAGVAQGLVESGKLTDLPPGAEGRLYPYYGGPFWHPRPLGFGFFGCFGPLLFILLLLVLFRGFWWGGPWAWKHRHGGRAMFEEWHRQAHGQGVEQSPPSA